MNLEQHYRLATTEEKEFYTRVLYPLTIPVLKRRVQRLSLPQRSAMERALD